MWVQDHQILPFSGALHFQAFCHRLVFVTAPQDLSRADRMYQSELTG